MIEKNQTVKAAPRFSLMIALVLFSYLSYAQVADTTVYVQSYDSAAPEVVEQETAPAVDTAWTDGDDEDVKVGAATDEETTHFMPVWIPGNSIDSIKLRKSDPRALRNDDEFWYANTIFKKKVQNEPRKGNFSAGNLYQTLLWMVIIGGFIAFLVIYLSNSNIGLLRRNRNVPLAEIDVETDDIFAINYEKEIGKAIASGNYRLGVRLLFLKLLRGLSDKNMIQYSHERTNFDYLMQAYHASWYQQFFRLTRHYEYAWYGQFEIDNSRFEIIQKDFSNFDRQLSQP